MKKLLLIAFLPLLVGCFESPSELNGTWRFRDKSVNGIIVSQYCDKYNKMYLNNRPTKEQWYADVVSKECKPFPLREIQFDVDSDGRHLWIDGWKYDYQILNGDTLKMWYTAYDTDGSPLNVIELWKRVL